MKQRLLLAVLAICAWEAPATAQRFVDLPLGSWANDVTPDGTLVVGTWEAIDGFIWRWQTEPEPTIVRGGDIVAVSDDGSVVAGNAFDPTAGTTVASIWTEAGGWQSLGWLPGAPCGSYSTAYDISGDGTTVVGLSWDNCSGRGFRWTEATGMQELQNLVNGNNRCSTISGDGLVLGGFAQGTFNRTPAFWDTSTAGEVINPNDVGEVFGFNQDGSTSVGEYLFSGNFPSAFVRDAHTGAMTNLGSLNGGGWIGQARDISEDGNVIVGNDVNFLLREAWVWTSTDGIISLNNRLLALGFTGVDPLFVCRAVSDDGSVVVGGGLDGGGGPFGFGGFIAALSDSAVVINRSGGSNPASYSASDPVLGATWTATVDLSQTGHSTAQILGNAKPLAETLAGGQVLLLGGARIFRLPPKTGPLATWSATLPNDPSLAGLPVFTQAVHLGGVTPFALSNSQDLVLGY